MPIYSGLTNIRTALERRLYIILVRYHHVDGLFMRFTGVPTGIGRQGKVRPSLTNEVEADRLFPVFEAFRFDSQVGF